MSLPLSLLMVLHILPVAAEDAGVNGPPEPEAAAADASGEETEAENTFVFDMQDAASYPERAETDAARLPTIRKHQPGRSCRR